MNPRMFQRLQNTEGNGGGGGNDFVTLIPTEFRGHPSLEPIKDMTGLVKSYISAQEMVGKNKVVVPGEGAKPEEWNEFFGKLGRPDDPSKYGLKKPEGLPEGFDIDDGFIEFLGKTFHESGLTARQAQSLYNRYMDFTKGEFTKAQQEANLKLTEEQAALKREWGNAYDARLDMAKRAVRAFLGEEQAAWLNKQGLDTNPQMLRVFATIGEKLGEPNADKGNGGGPGFGPLTPQMAQAEINQKMGDEEFMKMYMVKEHPRHQWAVDQMQRLYAAAHPAAKSA